MTTFELHDLRGDLVESRHRVDAVVVRDTGETMASTDVGSRPVYWRSTAKPFQLLPLVERSGVERFGLTSEHLALACASHNAEPEHRRIASDWLERIGCTEADLSCGGHPSLSNKVAERMIRDGVTPTPLWSNCSGKHAGMLALARLEGWPTAGYQATGHPVQVAVAETLAVWTDLPLADMQWGVDGCTAAAVATPLDRLALAWARLGTSEGPMAVVREAMLAHPFLVAGTGRLDTEVMQAWPGEVLAKVGAEGVFVASLPRFGVGLALKVEDGDMRAAGIALVNLLAQTVKHVAPDEKTFQESLFPKLSPEVRNTRGVVTGRTVASGQLIFG